MRRSTPQPFAHRPRLLIHRRWPCSRWPVPARPASGCRGGQHRLCRIASSSGPVATKDSEFEHHLWPDKHAVLRTWNRSGTLGSMAELKGRNAPTPSNKKATPQGGFLISSAWGDQLTRHQLESCGVKNVLPGIDLFSQGATPQILSALHRFTAEFEMDRSGSNAPWTPG